MCFVRACRIGFADMSLVLKLSHHSTGTDLEEFVILSVRIVSR